MKKGFTLIELLAVILILGIIALIAIPVVSNVIEESRYGAFESTLTNIEKKVEETCTLEQIKDGEIIKYYTITNGKPNPTLEIKGDLPDGEIFLDDECKVDYTLSNAKYVATKKFNDDKPVITKCNSNCKKYTENKLNGSDPVLDEGLLPVEISNNGIVKLANTYTSWYSYSDKRWANAVSVKENVREKYKNLYSDTVIDKNDILAYFVWIPRFKYYIPTGGTINPSTIKVIFENNKTSKSTGNATTEYYTHPAFTFGNTEVNGIWVGKFETTGTESAPTILPNTSSLREINAGTQFSIALSLKSNTYGITSSSHMMKSSEWGAAAYLSHSVYGINNEIRVNNNEGFNTGCGASNDNAEANAKCQIAYGGASNYPQSTTGNITGIFDMSGGSWERVMGVYNSQFDLSGFDSIPNQKYFDNFTTEESKTACSGKICYGHALSETASWYDDYPNFVNSNDSWLSRGGSNNSGAFAGVFHSYELGGYGGTFLSFRIVLSQE